MKAVFVESSIFEKHRSDYMSDGEYSAFQRELLSEPVKGDVIQYRVLVDCERLEWLQKAKVSVVVQESFITTSTDIVVSIYSPFMQKMKCQI